MILKFSSYNIFLLSNLMRILADIFYTTEWSRYGTKYQNMVVTALNVNQFKTG